MNETIIYELHVGGFTRSPSSGVEHPGAFAGIIEKIPYLESLGVTAVELLPVFEFDDSEVQFVDGKRVTNYWGYSPMSYFLLIRVTAFSRPADATCASSAIW